MFTTIASLFYAYLLMQLQADLRSAQSILQQYKGNIPFAAWLKEYFRQHKKYGSRDRKLVADLCFCYFRLGEAFKSFSEEERLLIGQFLCHEESLFIKEIKPEWNDNSFSSLNEKIEFLVAGETGAIFSLADEITPEIEKEDFQLSFLQQPDLFLRIRPEKEQTVFKKLAEAGIIFSNDGNCVRLTNNTKADAILSMDEEVIVQDVSSQKVLEPLLSQHSHLKHQFSAWDCCAASGGKTILLHDTYPKAKLTVSDIRESILVNLKNRLKRAGITSYRSVVADVSSSGFSLPQKFDVIICDAPCSGSGTWGRTPEQLTFFQREKIEHYALLQKKIALNASRSLKDGGFFLYITCSVFQRENEDVVNYLQQNSQMQVLSQQYFKGYRTRGDTLFTALFTASRTP